MRVAREQICSHIWMFQAGTRTQYDVIYQRVEVNQGAGYNVASGRFRATIAGTYFVYTSGGGSSDHVTTRIACVDPSE